MASFRKTLSKTGLISLIRKGFVRIDNPVKERTYSLCDYLMSAFAMFSLKYPSLLQFDSAARSEGKIRKNMRNLFNIAKVPCDTAMRKVIDLVDPKSLCVVFHGIIAQLQRGKVLDDYHYMGKHIIISIDGTGWFHSSNVHCKDCCEKHHRDGTISYYHQMLAGVILHPDQKSVFPFPPEPIKRTEGMTKNDCELNAARRMVKDIRRTHPHMKIIVVLDGLYSKAPFIEHLEDHDMKYVITARSGDHAWLFEQLDTSSEVENYETTDERKTNHRFRYLQNASLNKSNPGLKVNALEYWETNEKGNTSHFCWVTDIPLDEETLMKVMRAGRGRWKIENETFNALKNHGYNLEHNYGHGKQHLSTNLGMLMMLAFLADQVELKCCKVFGGALKKKKRMLYLRSKMRTLFDDYIVTDWLTLYNSIAYGYEDTALKALDTS